MAKGQWVKKQKYEKFGKGPNFSEIGSRHKYKSEIEMVQVQIIKRYALEFRNGSGGKGVL